MTCTLMSVMGIHNLHCQWHWGCSDAANHVCLKRNEQPVHIFFFFFFSKQYWVIRLALPTETLAPRSLSALDFLDKLVSICERSSTLCGRSPNKIVNHHNLSSFRTIFWSNWGSLTHMTKLLWQGELCLWYKPFYLFLSLYFFIFSPWIYPVEIAKKYMCWSQQSWNAFTVFLLHEIGSFIYYTQQKQIRIKKYLPILSA